MLYEHSQSVSAEAILFEDHFSTDFVKPDVIFEKKISEENVSRDDRQYVIRHHDEILASGGMMLNYNMPYADLYYEVSEAHRGTGLGSYLVQELKKEAYLMGRVPAARCNIKNKASKATLLKAGFRICGWRLSGKI
jgi:RimJ/RimL family protein N-acetyltransferase